MRSGPMSRLRGRVALAVLVVVVLAVAYVAVRDLRGGGGAPPGVPARHAAQIPGWLTTRGTRMVTSSGRSVRLLGLDEAGLIECWSVPTLPIVCLLIESPLN